MTFALDTDNGMSAILTGQSPASTLKNPSLVSGFNTTVYDAQQARVAQFRVGNMELRTGGILSSIPVYQFSNIGQRKIEAWPCVSFQLTTLSYDLSARRMHPRDKISVPVEGSLVTTLSAYGTTLTGYSQRTVRVHPEPYKVRYDVGVWARDTTQSHLIVGSMLSLMPPNSFLPVVFNDGSVYNLDMHLVQMAEMDDEKSELDRYEDGRNWHTVLTYEIETWLDTTLATQLVCTITKPFTINSSRLPNT